MTREPTALPTDPACPKATVSLRTLDVPGPGELRAAWLALPIETRDRIGALAVEMVFHAYLAGDGYAPEDRVLFDPEASAEADERADEANEALHETVEAALPALFGTEAGHPAWATAQ